jgi:hypothetical protein
LNAARKWRPTFFLPAGDKKVDRHKRRQISDLCSEDPAPSIEKWRFCPSKNRQFPPFFGIVQSCAGLVSSTISSNMNEVTLTAKVSDAKPTMMGETAPTPTGKVLFEMIMPRKTKIAASVVVILGRVILIVVLFLGGGRTGNRVCAVDPSAQIDEAAAIAAEGKGREGADPGDFVGVGTGWTASPDHGSLFEGAGAALAGSLLDGLEDSVDDLDSAAGFAGSLDDLSASAAFLYESLR